MFETYLRRAAATNLMRHASMSDKPPTGCLFALLRLFGLSGGDTSPSKVLPYRLAPFLSAAELSFFHTLMAAVNGRAVVNCKVNLGDIFSVEGRANFRVHRNRIDRKHVDFLLCSPQELRPLIAVELDDVSHQKPDRIERDDFVNAVFATAGLPLLRVVCRASYDVQQLAVDLAPYLVPQSMQPAVPACPQCGAQMVQRLASQGARAGQLFWGCSTYPKCRGTV